MKLALHAPAVSLLLLLLLAPLGRGQYMSGYGTGPYIPELDLVPSGFGADSSKWDDAKSASLFAIQYYGNNDIGRSDPFPNKESPYKYHPPLFPSVSTGTLPPPLPPRAHYFDEFPIY